MTQAPPAPQLRLSGPAVLPQMEPGPTRLKTKQKPGRQGCCGKDPGPARLEQILNNIAGSACRQHEKSADPVCVNIE